MPFNASTSRQSRQAHKKEKDICSFLFYCFDSDENAVLRSADFDNSGMSGELKNKKFAKTSICLKDK